MPVVVTAVFTPAPGRKDDLVEALRSTIPGVHDEQGCLLYAIHDADDGTVTMIEKWESAADLDAHGSGPAVAALQAAVDGLVDGPVAVVRMAPIPVGDAAGVLQVPGSTVTTILSIQSSVAYGHVGNSAATFPLMRMGVEVWPVITVHFSNNTGYASWRGPLLTADDVREVVGGIDDLGVLGECDAVLSGYQGAADSGRAILDAVALVKERNPAAVYCCDPVLGDVGRGFFVRAGIPELMRDAVVPQAQVVTPNQFELEFLSGREVRSLDDVVAAAHAVRALGPETVLVTSADVADRAAGTLDLVVVSGDGAWTVTTPRLEGVFQGAGDLTAAVFLARLLQTDDPADAAAWTASVVFGVLDATRRSGRRELQLVAAQDELVRPSHRFEPVPLA